MADNQIGVYRSVPQSLTQSLSGRLRSAILGESDITLRDDDIRALTLLKNEPEPVLVTPDQVRKMYGVFSANRTAEKDKTDEQRAEEMRIWEEVLSDVTYQDLRAVYHEFEKNCKFMPEPRDIRAAALKASSTRKYMKSRARTLLFMDAQQWKPRGPVMTPEEFAQAKAEMEKRDD